MSWTEMFSNSCKQSLKPALLRSAMFNFDMLIRLRTVSFPSPKFQIWKKNLHFVVQPLWVKWHFSWSFGNLTRSFALFANLNRPTKWSFYPRRLTYVGILFWTNNCVFSRTWLFRYNHLHSSKYSWTSHKTCRQVSSAERRPYSSPQKCRDRRKVRRPKS